MSADAVVLAAGKGTRMKSALPKLLHPLAGKPMLTRVLDSLARAGFPCPLVLVGYEGDRIRAAMGGRCRYVEQGEQRGTGHAARVALDAIEPAANRLLLVHGDEPLVPAEVYGQMLESAARTGSPVVLLTTRVEDTRGFGRLIRADGHPVALVQEGDLTPEQRSVDEVNLGAYVFDVAFLRRHLPTLRPHPPKGEYYLTDVVALAVEAWQEGKGAPVEVIEIEGGERVMGVNDLVQLEAATAYVYRERNRRLMLSGVTIVDSATTFVDEDATVEPDVVIHPFTLIVGDTSIGPGCTIGPGARVVSSRVGARCSIVSSTVEYATVHDGASIGPYAHLRAGAEVGADAEVGNYAEIKGSVLGPGSKMHHFSYLGDASVGAGVNIGAGTVTCNFDGKRKHRTVIGDGAFIGSDTMLRAPVSVGAGAVTGAGSVVTRDVEPGEVVAGVPARSLRRRTAVEEPQTGDEGA